MATRRSLAMTLGGVAAAAAIVFTGAHEGISNTPYRDTGGVWTVCQGQTGVPMHYYTNAQCDAMLAASLEKFAEQIAMSTPGYTAMPDCVKVATLDFAYNVGINAYNGSTYRRMLTRGKLPAACDELLRWRMVAGRDCGVRANGCYGIWERRQEERRMCRGEIQIATK